MAGAATAMLLGGCAFSADLEPGYQDHVDSREDYEESEEYLEAQGDAYAEQQRSEDLAAGGWSCYWAPTMNDDWHDDYECSNGVAFDRPYLLPDDPFIERWEIDAAAVAYASMLNS